MKTIVLNGRVKIGHRIASGLNKDVSLKLNNTICLQKPFFKKANVLGIEKIYNGTINLDISPKKLKILRVDYSVTCEWIKGVTETFWLVKVVVLFKSIKYDGYIYYPCPSEIKSHDDSIIELLVQKIPNIKYGDPISIQVSNQKIRLI